MSRRSRDKTDPETSLTGVKTDCPDILKEIIIAKNMEVTCLKREVPIENVVAKIGRQESPLNFGPALTGRGIKIRAECKRASPSRGTLGKGASLGSGRCLTDSSHAGPGPASESKNVAERYGMQC